MHFIKVEKPFHFERICVKKNKNLIIGLWKLLKNIFIFLKL